MTTFMKSIFEEREIKSTVDIDILRTLLENTSEIKINNPKHWFLYLGEKVDATNTNINNKNTYIYEVGQITLSDYIESNIWELYPNIFIEKNELFTEYVNGKLDCNFFPPAEVCNYKDAYYNPTNNDEIINVIVNSYPINVTHYNYNNTVIPKEEPIKEIKETNLTRNTYLMVDGNGYYKIGKSYNPKARETTLQSENPTIELVAYLEKDIETLLHREFKSKRKRGEWFNLTYKEVKYIINNYKFKKVDKPDN